MLSVSLDKGDYVMVGNAMVRFSHFNERNKNLVSLTIEAARDIPIMRGELYEKMLYEMARQGNEEAKAGLQKLAEAKAKYEQSRKDAIKRRKERNREKLMRKREQKAGISEVAEIAN